MRLNKIILFLAFATAISSCTGPSPRKVVAQTWLNVNLVTAHYSPKFFTELRERKANNNITVYKDNAVTKGTAVEYVTQNVIGPLDEALKKVERLPVENDTKALIQASLEVFRYSREVFENDYLAIARSIDEKQPEDAIETAVDELFAKHDGAIQTRLDRLDSYAIPYAEKHNIPIQK
ncbi:hypothetical protein [Sinomicrobium soli]|uniref:hypothetical protein n=1 Tax=Sinomicrobium sp. N-1-3-6 TaxID=2219864 RepID=UPI000DCEC198|nr:hypothetical protein [Sinomicrobium sp. N-1-3-6]RAV28691.1 hypothetical protein DN748_12110 [Sinomicrobium sp. N-1-3-6]